MRNLEAVQPRHQPLGRKDGCNGNGQQVLVWLLRKGNSARELAKAALKISQDLSSELRWNQALWGAGKKRAAQLLLGFQNLLAHCADGNAKFFRGQGKSSQPSHNFHGAQAVEVNLIEVFNIVFLQPLAAKLHTKFRAEVSDRTGKETSDELQVVYIKVHQKTARQC